MLILAHTNGLGLDLHQLSQRILQATRNRHGATQAHVQIWKFLGGRFGGRIHRCASFAHHHLGKLRIAEFLDHLASELVGFARGGAIADGDQVNAMLLAQLGQLHQRLVPLLAWFVRIDGVGGEQFAGGIDHGHLYAGADARIQAHHGLGAGRCGQHQILEVVAEHADGFVFRAFAHATEQVEREVQMQLHAPGHAHGFAQPCIGRAAAIDDAGMGCHAAFAFLMALLGIDVRRQLKLDHAFVACAHQREQPMRGNLADGFDVVEIVAELRAFVLLAFDHLGADLALVPQPVAQFAEQAGIFGDAFHQDRAGAVERGAHVRHALFGVDEGFGHGFGRLAGVFAQAHRERLQASFTRNLRLGATLGLVRQVEIFQARLGVSGEEVTLQRIGHLALFIDAGEDRAAAFLQLAQVAQALFEQA